MQHQASPAVACPSCQTLGRYHSATDRDAPRFTRIPGLVSSFCTLRLSAMSIRSIFMSAFLKQCPHCKKTINTRELRKVSRVAVRRWYQFTHGPRAACPQCGGFVVSTIDNSPWLLALLLALAGGAVSAVVWPSVGNFLNSVFGRVVMMSLVCAWAWLVAKQSGL